MLSLLLYRRILAYSSPIKEALELSEINLTNLFILLGIFIATYALIVWKNFDKNMAASLGALASLIIGNAIGVFTQEEFLTVELAHDYVILAVLFGNLLIVAVASEVGIFQFISVFLLKITRGNPKKLYYTLAGLTFLLSAVVNTIPAILVVGALTIVATQELGYDPKPYILMEIVVTNTGGLTTVISAITNLIIAAPFKIGFLQFIVIGAPLAIILLAVSIFMMIRIVPIPQISEEELEEKQFQIAGYNEWNVVKDVRKFKLTGAVFAITMLLLLLSDNVGMDISVIAVGGGIIMVYTSGYTFEKILPKVDWTLLGFFTSLFVLIKGLELVGLLDLLSNFLVYVMDEWLNGNSILSALLILLFSSAFSGVLDNVVLAVALTPILEKIAVSNPALHIGGMVWALIIGTNLGGGLTPIGAPPVVLGLGILYRETGSKVGWGEFFKKVGMVTLVRIFISAIYVIFLVLLFSSNSLTNL